MSKYSDNMPPDLKAAIGWLYDYVEPGKMFLDFGCATGYFGSLIKTAKKCQVYGVEISDDAKKARKVLDGVYSFDLDGPWPEEIYERRYDYLFFGDVLEHLKQPEEALKKAARLLKKPGKIFVSVPNIAHMSPRLELLQGSFEYESMGILDNTHLKYFTLASFARLASDAGYVIEKVDYTFDDLPSAVITKILSKVGLKPSKKFWDMADSVEARAHQYKFILVPAAAGKSVRQTNLPVTPLSEKPDKERDNYINDLRRQTVALHAHADKQAEIIEHYVNRSKELEAELARLKHGLGHRMESVLKARLKRRKD